jgi:pimeloyl-ACP methyl ester carboxylesterase
MDIAISARTQFTQVNGRTLAYRTLGTGSPIVLCMRFRGTMDLWDPAFLDGLVDNGFKVVIFDYSGLGQSTGVKTYNPAEMVADVRDLIDALGLAPAIVGGWSLGGLVAQVALAAIPDRISHLVLLGCVPPNSTAKIAEQLFYDTARKPDYTGDDHAVLFFEPDSPMSVRLAQASVERIAQRKEDLSPPVPYGWAGDQIGDTPRLPMFPAPAVLDAMKSTTIPILHVGGDHDIPFRSKTGTCSTTNCRRCSS